MSLANSFLTLRMLFLICCWPSDSLSEHFLRHTWFLCVYVCAHVCKNNKQKASVWSTGEDNEQVRVLTLFPPGSKLRSMLPGAVAAGSKLLPRVRAPGCAALYLRPPGQGRMLQVQSIENVNASLSLNSTRWTFSTRRGRPTSVFLELLKAHWPFKYGCCGIWLWKLFLNP